MEFRENDPATWPVVISIHGIRTTGRWQKELTDVLISARFRHVPLDFGFFPVFSLLMPWSRSRKVEWFHREYSKKFASSYRRPSIIAHSFGSYIVTRAMLKYDDIRFERMILCGSIVSRSYPWRAVLQQRDQADAVLNEAGGRDLWAAVVEWVVSDAGSSGVSGFEETVEGRLVQLIHERHEHSDYFYRQNYERRWLPFLQNQPVQAVLAVGAGSVNRKFLFTTCVLLASAAALVWLAVNGRGAERLAGLAWLSGASPSAQSQAQLGATTDIVQLPKPSAPAQTSPPAPVVDAEAIRRERVEQWFAHLRGDWVQAGDLPQSIEDGAVIRCVVSRNARTILSFESMDETEGTISAAWRQDGVSAHRLMSRKTGPQPFDTTIRERRECLGEKGTNPASRSFWEVGRFSVSAVGARDEPAEASLKIGECNLDGEDCPPLTYGNRPMAPLEVIGEDRLRLGELMFIRQETQS